MSAEQKTKRAVWRLEHQLEKLTNEERKRLSLLAQLGERALEILRAPQTSSSYLTVNRAADADLIEIEARHLGLLPESKP